MRIGAAATLWTFLAGAAIAADNAEFAIRWDPKDGGPRTIEEVKVLLRLSGRKSKSFAVRYFDVSQPSGMPPDFSAIARERTRLGRGRSTESMYKLRSATQFPASGPMSNWACPFLRDTQHKSEVDVGWTMDGTPKRKYSRSCDADGFIRDLLPAELRAKPSGCTSRVLRVEAKGIKIERWTLQGGEQTFEVSRNGQDTPADLERFAVQVVRPLVTSGVKALTESKTEMGSHC